MGDEDSEIEFGDNGHVLTPEEERRIWGPRGIDGRELMLWEVDLGGSLHWVSARDAAEAVRVAYESDCFDGGEDDAALSVERVSSLRAGELVFIQEDGKACPMREQFMRHKTPSHVASADW